MKKIMMFYLPTCPFCIEAFAFVEELKAEYPEFQGLEIQTINEKEEEELANSYDYHYVPTYYVDGVKLHEGISDKDMIEAVLRAAIA